MIFLNYSIDYFSELIQYKIELHICARQFTVKPKII